MDGQDVAGRNELLEGYKTSAVFGLHLRRRAARIVVNDVRLKALQPPLDRAADIAEAENAHHLAGDLAAVRPHFRIEETAGPHVPVRVREAAERREDQHDRMR